MTTYIFIPSVSPGTSKSGVKYKGTIEVPNLSDENDMEDLDVSFINNLPKRSQTASVQFEPCVQASSCHLSQITVSLNKDEPETLLTNLMKTKGAEKVREALGSYVGFLKTGK